MTSSEAPPSGAERFRDRVAVVTGAASGIGAATAARLAREGASVVLMDVSPRVSAVADQLRNAGGTATAQVADVSDPARWSQVVNAAQEEFGPVDLLVSNAFTLDFAAAHETTPESWERQIAVNLTAAHLGFTACLPGMRTSTHPGGAAATFVSSVHAFIGLPGHPAYAASKGGLISLARQLAVEYGPDVRVNTVAPGPIVSGAWDRVSDEDRELSARATVAGRLGSADEAAAAIAFLLSADASFITGASLVVDGGWSVMKASA